MIAGMNAIPTVKTSFPKIGKRMAQTESEMSDPDGLCESCGREAVARRFGVVDPLIISYYGTVNVSEVSKPLPTITAKDRFGLVKFGDGKYLDIHFRMLHWKELAAAHSFPPAYEFYGNQDDIVKQIGNSVPTALAEALAFTSLS